MFESWLKNTSAHFGEIESGYRRGEQNARLEIAKELSALGVALDIVAQATGYSIGELAQFHQQTNGA